LFDRGVIKGHEKFFISTAHSDLDIDTTIEAVNETVAEISKQRNARSI